MRDIYTPRHIRAHAGTIVAEQDKRVQLKRRTRGRVGEIEMVISNSSPRNAQPSRWRCKYRRCWSALTQPTSARVFHCICGSREILEIQTTWHAVPSVAIINAQKMTLKGIARDSFLFNLFRTTVHVRKPGRKTIQAMIKYLIMDYIRKNDGLVRVRSSLCAACVLFMTFIS